MNSMPITIPSQIAVDCKSVHLPLMRGPAHLDKGDLVL